MTNVCGLKLKNRKLLAILLYSDTQSTSVFSPRATVWYNARGKKQATSIVSTGFKDGGWRTGLGKYLKTFEL